MRFFLVICLLLPLEKFAQSSLDYFNSLPEDIRNQVLVEEADFETVQIENSLNDVEDNKEEDKFVEEPFYGYNFFKKFSDTNTPVLDIPLQADYLISFNDELELLLSGSINELYKLRVDLSGNILIPRIGSVSVLNLSLSKANEKIGKLISDSYIGAVANLSVVKPSLKKISVIGSVVKPGTFLVNPFVSISEAIKYAEGLEENASIRNIKILKADGSSETFDLYKFLIFGDRSIDINLQNGDTVHVTATSNYVEVDGEVLRPNKYEYLPTDKISDLISFAQGLTNIANSQNIFINALNGSQINSYLVSKDKVIGELRLEGLNVGSTVSVSRKNVFVAGESVTSGYFDYEEGELVADFLNKLSFSNDIYPFFFIVSQDSGAGLQTKYFNLSLADPISYENIKLAQNVNIQFFSKSQILRLNELNELNEQNELDNETTLDITEDEFREMEELKTTLPDDKTYVISIGEKTLSIPLAGRITAQSVYDYLGFNIEIDSSNVSVATREKIELNAFSKPFIADNLVSITLPPRQNQTMTVSISGNIMSPGTYVVPLRTTIDELYEIAGGFMDGASSKGIVLAREAIKVLERKALEGAKRIIMDTVISQQSNALALGNSSNVDLASFASLMSETVVTGRVTGDFSPGSTSSKQTVLQDGDEIFIPSVISTVTVTGEVLNPITTGFEIDSTYEDYIEAAGGLTSFADSGAIYIIRSNGTSVRYSKGFMVKNQYPEPGDTIVIPRDYDQIQGLPLVSVATKIISDIAFAAASLNSISN